MAHACGCRPGSSGNCGDSLAPIRSEDHRGGAGLTLAAAAASVGMPVAAALAALSAGRKAPA